MSLTEEQINKEEWKSRLIFPDGSIVFQKGTRKKGYELVFDPNNLTVHFAELDYFGLDDIYRRNQLTRHPLKCTDLDLFRTIIKILEIK